MLRKIRALKHSPVAATLIGLVAPVAWAMNVPIMRAIVEGFGMAPGECLLYAMATVIVALSLRIPDVKADDKRYLVFGIGSAVACTICLVFAVYFSVGGAQTLEVGMVNYLWPALTIVFSVLLTGVKANFWLIPGLLICISSVFWIVSNGEFSLLRFIAHVTENPLSYLLALGAALFWTLYSIFTILWGRGQNFSTIILALDSIFFAFLWIAGFGDDTVVTVKGVVSLLVGGFAIGLAYGCWTHGVLHGNITVLSMASYFTPVMSCVFGAIWLGAQLSTSFWIGSLFLVFGSIVCWFSTKEASAGNQKPK